MQPHDLDQALAAILARDTRYHKEAYLLVREALDYTQNAIRRANRGKVRHITGPELLAGIRAYALSQYGPMTLTLLNEWGLSRCEDFGEIVFNMVDHSILSKTEKDSRADFQKGYEFDEAFRKPFLPAKPLGGRPSAVEPEIEPSEKSEM